MVQLALDPDPRLTFELACTREDLEAAFRLLHDSYVSAGFMNPAASGMRITPYHALPTTSTLVAKWDGRVIGTVSLITRTGLGLPLEKVFSLADLDRNGAQFVEISSLAIHHEFRNRMNILFLLCKYLHEYCREHLAADYMVIAVNPRDQFLYQDIMLFKKLQDVVVKSYGFVNGAPAVGLYMDLRNAHNTLMETYLQAPPKRNLFSFFMLSKRPPCFRFPARRYFRAFDSVMTPQLLDHFFNRVENVFKTLPEEQLDLLRRCYQHSHEHLAILPERKAESYRSVETRYRVGCYAIGYDLVTGRSADFRILDASENGFQAAVPTDVAVGDQYQVRIRIGETEAAELDASVVWVDSKGAAGFRIGRQASVWKTFIAALKEGNHAQPYRGIRVA